MRGKADHYTQQAKREGYPARSVYKLKELDEKMRLLPASGTILDVGAAPGSWSLYAQRRRKSCRLVAVDLKPLEAVLDKETATVLLGDIFDAGLRKRIEEFAPYRLIMSDAAPSTTGNRTVDCGRSYSLTEGILGLVPELLAPGGNFIAKIFQGGMERRLLTLLQQEFRTARMIKPKACRSESFETFLVGIDYHGNS
jgi:23S rRNA (uridine2552-2'-O)-methyltransferase